jgi:hypothetical protein
MRGTFDPATETPRKPRRHRAILIWLGFLVVASMAVADPPPPKPRPITPTPPGGEPSNRHFVTKRGEVVDFYCYIEKGLKGLGHHECAVKCVSGDVCMGLLTTDGELYMISVNHLRAMTPTAFQGIPDPWFKCRQLISEQVDLSGYAMERKGQKIIEIMDVYKAGQAPK